MKYDTMKNILYTLAVLVLSTCYINSQELSENTAFDILVKWEGKWQNSAVFEATAWIPKRVETRGKTESNLILSNNYLEIMVYNGNSVGKHIIRYDQMSRQFNRWEFKNDGSNSFWTGKWNDKEQTMYWNFIDFSNAGISGQIIETFKSNGEIKTSVFMEDKNGTSLLKINGTKVKL